MASPLEQLHAAISGVNVEAVRRIVPTVDTDTLNRETYPLHCLCKAVDMGSSEIVQVLLEAKALPDVSSSGGFTALMGSEKLEISELLVEAKANVNAQTGNGGTALFYASINGHLDIVRFLLKHGADASVKGIVSAALYEREAEIVRVLALEGGALRDWTPEDSVAAIDSLRPTGRETMIALLNELLELTDFERDGMVKSAAKLN